MDNSEGFIQYMFKFDNNIKSDLSNLIQYSLLSIIPIVGFNKLIQSYIPEADEDKSTLELSVEIIIQIIIMFVGMYFINRLIIYLPTYSTTPYPEYYTHYNVISTLMIALSLQTKLGEKISILTSRLSELINGAPTKPKKEETTGNTHIPSQIIPPQPTTTPLPEPQEPLAASDALGGGWGSNW